MQRVSESSLIEIPTPCSSGNLGESPPSLKGEWVSQKRYKRTDCPQVVVEHIAERRAEPLAQGPQGPGTVAGGVSPHGDGSIPTAIGVIHNSVEGLVHPLPEHHSRSLPEGAKIDYLYLFLHSSLPFLNPQYYFFLFLCVLCLTCMCA